MAMADSLSALAKDSRVFLTDTGLAGDVTSAPGPGAPPVSNIAQEVDEGLVALKSTVAGTTEENQATMLLKKRKDMRMVEDALETVKREFRERMERLSERQLRFEEKQKALQEMVAKFKPFIEENDAKRARADKKSAEEAATRLRIEGDLAFLIRELELLRAENEAIERDIARLRRYARYLEEVVSNSSSGFLFDSASDVLARYKMLRGTNSDLHGQASANASELDDLRTRVAGTQKKMRDIALVATSGGQDVRSQLETLRATVADLTSQKEFAETDVRLLRAAAGQTVSSIRNLYARVIVTAPPTSLPTISVNGKVVPPPVFTTHAAVASTHGAGGGGGSTGFGSGAASGAGPSIGSAPPARSAGESESKSGGAARSSMRLAGGSTLLQGSTSSVGKGAFSASGGPSGPTQAAAADAGSSVVDSAEYLGQCLHIIGDRISDLAAMVAEFPAYKEATARDREAAAKARQALTGKAALHAAAGGAAAGGVGGRTGGDVTASASLSQPSAAHGGGMAGGGMSSPGGGTTAASAAGTAAFGVRFGGPMGMSASGGAAASSNGGAGLGHGGGVSASVMGAAPLVPGTHLVAGAASNIYVASRTAGPAGHGGVLQSAGTPGSTAGHTMPRR